ncbi:discoidin domain-containing protein [Luteolibacter arcticus]|uniref:Discoidin domain-containing protein n=1 Tax=Luteolibacter arcticus TaxID=1581411 RepID=A0ABT3GLQ2_9BACT|nr:discoidin domain-containing protein [Luteolibacter arcticus]MCW1924457.1 discoidin domain-containing protein [Luteolibacter arcticus]
MHQTLRAHSIRPILLALALISESSVHAASLSWNAAVNSDWDTATANWSGGTIWNNATPDQAVFGAAGVGTVSLTTGITANRLTFAAGGYTITGNILTLGGAAPALTADADVTISSVLAGNTAVTKNGAGKLTLKSANTITGPLAVTQGTLELATGGTLSRGTIISGPTANNAAFNLAGGIYTSTGGGITVGNANTETGTLNIATGSLAISGGELNIGNANGSTATWNQSGGSVTVSTGNHIYTGMGTGSGVTTTLGFSGGSFTLSPGNGSVTFSIGGRSQTTVNVSGSAFVDSHQTRFGWGADLTATDGGTLSLNGGTWKTNRLYREVTVQKSEVNFDGGKLQARQSNATFMSGLGSANIKEGGAKIDSNGFIITLAQPLLHGGTAAIDGGLAKSGEGTLSLAGACTFTGPIQVNGGTLSLSGSLPAGFPLTVTDGSFAFASAGQSAGVVTLGDNGGLEIGANAAVTTGSLNVGASAADTATLKIAVGSAAYVPLQCSSITANGSAGSIGVEVSGGLNGAGTYHLIACPSPIGGTGFSAFRLITTAVAGYTFQLVQNPGFIDVVVAEVPLPSLETGELAVSLDPTFPQVIRYRLKSNGAVLEAGDATAAHVVRINGTTHAASVTAFSQSGNEALYTLRVPGFDIDISYRFVVDGTVVTRSITAITGTGEPAVQTINLGTPVLRADINQAGANAAFVRNVNPDLYANYSGDMAGDTFGAVSNLATGSWDSTWCFVGTSEVVGTGSNNLFDYPFTVQVGTIAGAKCAAIYDRDYNYRIKDIKPGIWFESKTCISGDSNGNGTVDWQDGAVWVREQLPPMLPALADHYARGGAWQQSSVGYLSNTTYSTVDTSYPLYASQMRKTYYQTEGVPQAIACAGWTYRGHDWMWSDWDQVVNPGGGGRAGYDKARAESARYNGDLSFHLNQDLSALECQHYDESIMAKDASGNKLGQYNYTGQTFFDISHFLDLQRGSQTSRINDFLDRFAPSPLVVYLDQMWDHPSALHNGNGLEEQYAKAMIVKTFRDRGTSTTTEGYQPSLFRNGMLQCKYRNNSISHIDDFVTAGKLMWQFTSGSTSEFSDPYYMMFGGKISQEFRSGNIFGGNNWMGNVMMEDTYLLTMMNAHMRRYPAMEYTSDSAKYQVRWGSDMFATVNKATGNFTLVQGNVTMADGADRFLPAPDGAMKIHVYSVGGSYGRAWTLPLAWSAVTRVDRYELTESGRTFIDRLPVLNGTVTLSTPGKVPYLLLPASGAVPLAGPIDRARGMVATASSVQGSNTAANAVDGDDSTAWTSSGDSGSWLMVDLGRELELNRVDLKEAENAITSFRLQIDVSGTWNDVASGTTIGSSLRKVFPNVRSTRVRLLIDTATAAVSIRSFTVHADANLAMTAAASASSNSNPGSWGDNYVEGALQWGRDIQASRAMDGSPDTYWRPSSGTAGVWLQATFSRSSKVNRVTLAENGNRVTGFKIQYLNGGTWTDLHSGTVIGASREIDFAEVEVTQIRLLVTAASNTPAIREFSMFDVGGAIAVINPPTNLAIGGTAIQSTTYSVSGPPQVASRAIDGNTDGDWNHNSVSCTANGSLGWWEVDMLAPKSIGQVKVWWRDPASTRDRNVDLVIYDANRQELRRIAVSGNAVPARPVVIDLTTAVTGQIVRLEHTAATNVSDPNDAQLCLAEVQVFAPQTGYSVWAGEMGLSALNDAMDADPDSDGQENLLEFAFGGDPLSTGDRGVFQLVPFGANGGPPFIFTLSALAGAVFTEMPDHSMTAEIGGITYQVECSADLTGWEEPMEEMEPITTGLPNPPAGYEYHSFIPIGLEDPGKCFSRVKITSP